MCVFFLFNFDSSCFVLFFFTLFLPVYLFPALHNSLPWLLGGVDNNNNNNNNNKACLAALKSSSPEYARVQRSGLLLRGLL